MTTTDADYQKAMLAGLKVIDRELRVALVLGAQVIRGQSDTVNALQGLCLLQAMQHIEQCPEQAASVNQLTEIVGKIAERLERAADATSRQMMELNGDRP